MSPWQKSLVVQARAAACRQEVFSTARAAARELDFEYCGYVCRTVLPCARPESIAISNFPQIVQDWYRQSGAVHFDPVFNHCRHSDRPILWGAIACTRISQIWAQAKKYGIAAACSQGVSAPSALGALGMVTFARGSREISEDELHYHEHSVAFIARLTHDAMLRVSQPEFECQAKLPLTSRECEVLRWTGDGKTIAEIALILSLSENTIKFHIKTASAKLNAVNKTAAVVKAALLGLLH